MLSAGLYFNCGINSNSTIATEIGYSLNLKEDEKIESDLNLKEDEKIESNLNLKEDEKIESDLNLKEDEKIESDLNLKENEKIESDLNLKENEKIESNLNLKENEKIESNLNLKNNNNNIEKLNNDKTYLDNIKICFDKIYQLCSNYNIEDITNNIEEIKQNLTEAFDNYKNIKFINCYEKELSELKNLSKKYMNDIISLITTSIKSVHENLSLTCDSLKMELDKKFENLVNDKNKQSEYKLNFDPSTKFKFLTQQKENLQNLIDILFEINELNKNLGLELNLDINNIENISKKLKTIHKVAKSHNVRKLYRLDDKLNRLDNIVNRQLNNIKICFDKIHQLSSNYNIEDNTIINNIEKMKKNLTEALNSYIDITNNIEEIKQNLTEAPDNYENIKFIDRYKKKLSELKNLSKEYMNKIISLIVTLIKSFYENLSLTCDSLNIELDKKIENLLNDKNKQSEYELNFDPLTKFKFLTQQKKNLQNLMDILFEINKPNIDSGLELNLDCFTNVEYLDIINGYRNNIENILIKLKQVLIEIDRQELDIKLQTLIDSNNNVYIKNKLDFNPFNRIIHLEKQKEDSKNSNCFNNINYDVNNYINNINNTIQNLQLICDEITKTKSKNKLEGKNYQN